MKTIKLDSVIELDQETDSLFERIAGTEGEIFDPGSLQLVNDAQGIIATLIVEAFPAAR